MRKMYKMIILLIIISISVSPVVSIDDQSTKDPVTYKVLIDQYFGFYRVFEMDGTLFGTEIDSGFNSSNKSLNATLNISIGDTIIWTNDAAPSKMMTIISKEKLWNLSREKLWDRENGTLRSNGKEFNYTFNKSGIYNVYVKERRILKQKITVGSIDTNDTNDTSPGLTSVTQTNDTKSNLTMKSGQNNTTAIKQNATLNKSNPVPVSVMLAGGIFSKIKSKSDISIMTIVLLGIYILSGRIKEKE